MEVTDRFEMNNIFEQASTVVSHNNYEETTPVNRFNVQSESRVQRPEAVGFGMEANENVNRNDIKQSWKVSKSNDSSGSSNRKPLLPPCKICGEPATGFHYGVNTCEACKGFFRRNIKKKEIRYKCKCTPERREIWKRGPSKDGCQACRYQRCLEVGMSKTAIKLGRYTYVHKTRNIKQAKYYQALGGYNFTTVESCKPKELGESNERDAPDSYAEEHRGCTTEGFARCNPKELGDCNTDVLENCNSCTRWESDNDYALGGDIGKVGKSYTHEEVAISIDSQISSPSSGSTASDLYCRPYTPEECSAYRSPENSQTPHFDRTSLLQSLEPSIHLKSVGVSLEEFSYIVRTLTDAHRALVAPEIPKEIIRKSHTEYLIKYHSPDHDKSVPDMNTQRHWVSNLFKLFEANIVKAVSFAKKIPGFTELTLDDQASLIRASRVEIALFNAYKAFLSYVDPERMVLTSNWGQVLHFNEIDHVLPIPTIMLRYNFAKKLDQLNLTLSELVVLRAMVTVASDKCELEKSDDVCNLQQKLFGCLEYLLSTRPGGRGSLMFKIMNFVTDLRLLTDCQEKFTKNMLHIWQTVSNDNFHLLKEIGS